MLSLLGLRYFLSGGGKIISLLPPWCCPAEKEFSVCSYGTSYSITGKTMKKIKSLNSCISVSSAAVGTKKSFSLSSFKSQAGSWLSLVWHAPYLQVVNQCSLGGGCRQLHYTGRGTFVLQISRWVPVIWQLLTCHAM